MKKKSGLTLIELILSTTLLAILSAASVGAFYWQAVTYSSVERRTDAFHRLLNTYLVMYKTIHQWKKSTIPIVEKSNVIQTSDLSDSSLIHDFQYNPALKVLYASSSALLENASASFSYNNESKLCSVKIELLDYPGELLHFVIHPRQ
ncbi:MAG: type II secretion system protein [Candidatus Riflebacteria bacterium]|nr:type II secretion system protein [Candidatus Riflebacteria bacterium]